MKRRGFILLVCLLFSALPARAEGLLVFAAASLKEPLDAIAAAYGDVTISYAGSGTIARQVLAGAPADVVVLANRDWMDVLEQAGRVAKPVDLLGNALVLIAPAPAEALALTPQDLDRALGQGRLAMGLTASVPAGIYGQQALERLGLWPHVSSRLAEVDNVRAVLALVARGEAPLGVVYATDARVSAAVTVVARFPPASHAPIRYSMGAVTGAAHPAAQDFAAYLRGGAAMAVFEAAGFEPLGPVE